jgi:hypothetical protein
VDENHFIGIGIFIEIVVKDFFSSQSMVQSLLTNNALRLSKKSSSGFSSNLLAIMI